MKKSFWLFKAIKIAFAVTAFFFLVGFVTMNLWNWLIPVLFKGPIISFCQAIGLLALAKILFGGFGRGSRCGGRRFGHNRWQQKMQERFANMTPEEKEKFKAKMQGRCGNRFGNFEEKTNVVVE
jgi:hypothetical protein